MAQLPNTQVLEAAGAFYQDSIRLLLDRDVPFLIGGAYAFGYYTGIVRKTKDLDLLVRPADVGLILELAAKRYRTERTHPHWLAKILCGDDLIDLIYRAGNGLCEIDDSWFLHARTARIFDLEVRMCAPEKMIWMKAFIMERERYDGADIAHLLQSCAERLNWRRLLGRFGPDWQLLLSHLVLFGYVYPSEQGAVPCGILQELSDLLVKENDSPPAERICRGTLLSRAQYLPDVNAHGFRDARLDHRCRITTEELEEWTELIPPEHQYLREQRT